MKVPAPFELDLPWGDRGFSHRFLKVVHDWGIPTEKEISFLAEYVSERGRKVLDLASGGGRHALGLASRGAEVTGIEIGASAVKAAQEEAARRRVAVDFIRGDIREISYRETFDLAFLICNQLTHFSPSDCRVVFERAAAALKKEGVFIIHLDALGEEDRASYVEWYMEKEPFYFSHPALVHREQFYLPETRTKIIRDFAVDTVTRRNHLFGVSQKYYTLEELIGVASPVRLEHAESFGDYDKTPLTEQSPHNIHVFRKA